MIDWLLASPAQRRLLPGGKFRGPTPWVIAIMTFVMMIVSAAALALVNAAGSVGSQAEGRYVAQVPTENGALPRVLQELGSVRGVTKVQAVPEAEMRRTLERWLGPSAANADLPVPALVHFDLAPGTDPATVSGRLVRISPGVAVSSHGEEIGPLLDTMRALQWLAFGMVLLMLLATSATVVLAARGALDTHRSTIEIMHGIGATDLQVTHLFQRKIALDSTVGAAAGAALALATILLLVGSNALIEAQFGGASPLHARDVFLLALLPLLLAIFATWVARTAVLAALRRST